MTDPATPATPPTPNSSHAHAGGHPVGQFYQRFVVEIFCTLMGAFVAITIVRYLDMPKNFWNFSATDFFAAVFTGGLFGVAWLSYGEWKKQKRVDRQLSLLDDFLCEVYVFERSVEHTMPFITVFLAAKALSSNAPPKSLNDFSKKIGAEKWHEFYKPVSDSFAKIRLIHANLKSYYDVSESEKWDELVSSCQACEAKVSTFIGLATRSALGDESVVVDPIFANEHNLKQEVDNIIKLTQRLHSIEIERLIGSGGKPPAGLGSAQDTPENSPPTNTNKAG